MEKGEPTVLRPMTDDDEKQAVYNVEGILILPSTMILPRGERELMGHTHPHHEHVGAVMILR